MSKSKREKVCLLCGPQDIPHFRFPKDPLLRTLWANFCEVDPTSVSINHKLCHRHFSEDDVIDNRTYGGSMFIRKGAVPSLHIENDDEEQCEDFSEHVSTTDVCNNVSSKITEDIDPLELSPEIIEVLLPENELEDTEQMNNSEIDEFKIDDVTCDYTNFEESKKTLQYLKGMLVKINKKIKLERQRGRRLTVKLKKIKNDILEFKRNNPNADIPLNLLDESTDEEDNEDVQIVNSS